MEYRLQEYEPLNTASDVGFSVFTAVALKSGLCDPVDVY
jgi:hypothetical protein